MALNPLLLLGLAGAGALALSATTHGASGVVEVKPGQTWLLTIRAVGAKVTQEQADAWKTQIAAVGVVNSIIVNGSGDTVAAVITYHAPTHILLNQLIALTTSPGRGLMITDATLQPSFTSIPQAPSQ